MAELRPLDNQPLRFAAGTDSNPVAEPSSANPRTEIQGDPDPMHCALLEWAASQDDLAPHLQGILVRLVKLMDEGGRINLKQADIAKAIRLSESQTREHIKALVGLGKLNRKRCGTVTKGRRPDILSAIFSDTADNADASVVSDENHDSADTTHVSALSPDNADTPTTSAGQRYRNGQSPKTAPQDARVKDNPLRVISPSSERSESLPNNHRAVARAAVAAAAEVDWKGRLAWVHATFPKAFNCAVGGTRHWSLLSNICHPVKGEPCDWDLDVVPAIIELAVQFEAKGDLMTTFELVKRVSLRKRDARLTGNPEPTAPPVQVNGNGYRNGHKAAPVLHDAKPPSWIDDMWAEIQAEAVAS